ncbi:HUWE1-associated protein modifying stress responses [Engraulis encrasicolus]|uniref:HUWE1-associated protein modifying stress responses n=1 Tax=Engraulis encrasicolus TaxID=184585 RepID=UPI002FD3A460
MSEEEEREKEIIHGPEHWFSKWERQCLSELTEEDHVEDSRGEERGGDGEEEEDAERRLWHLFQNSATAVAQLYKERVCPHHQSVALWVPFQNAATAVTDLYKESMSAYESGVQSGLQRRRQEVLSWVTKRRRMIRREELISFLCGKKGPPPHSRVAMVMPNHTQPSVASPSPPDTDLTPFTQAIALHGASPHLSSSVAAPCVRRRNCTLQQETIDLSSSFTTHQNMTSHTQDVTSHATEHRDHREHAHQPIGSLPSSQQPINNLHSSNRPINSLHSSHQPMATHVEHIELASLRKRPSEPQATADSLTHKRHRYT